MKKRSVWQMIKILGGSVILGNKNSMLQNTEVLKTHGRKVQHKGNNSSAQYNDF